jgi:hypothetical protein
MPIFYKTLEKQAFYAQRPLRWAKLVLCPRLVLYGFFKGAFSPLPVSPKAHRQTNDF